MKSGGKKTPSRFTVPSIRNTLLTTDGEQGGNTNFYSPRTCDSRFKLHIEDSIVFFVSGGKFLTPTSRIKKSDWQKIYCLNR